MRSPRPAWLLALALVWPVPAAQAQSAPVDRLPPSVFDVTPPVARVTGVPGEMRVRPMPCRTVPLPQVRRRIVDAAVQEWAFFGFPVRDEVAFAAIESAMAAEQLAEQPSGSVSPWDASSLRRAFFPRLSDEDAARVAASVAGYWAVTPEAGAMVARQNASWRGPAGAGRADPWSAAFVSWVMCEAGLGSPGRFQRAIAHHVYIDQAIRARQGSAPEAAFVAHDAGEVPIVPGDLLCAARRPVYRTLAERRRQLGVGARTHCDVVVKVDGAGGRIHAIGGNVGRAVSLKVLPVVRGRSGHVQAASVDEGRPVFAHLQLRAAPIEAHALDTSPTIKALAPSSR